MVGLYLIQGVLAFAWTDTAPPSDIVTDVFRQLTSGAQGGRVLCLAVGKSDPSSGVMTVLNGSRALLRVASKCQYVGTDDHAKAQTLDGQPAEFLALSGFRQVAPDVVEVEIWYRSGSWRGHGSTVRVRKTNGRWTIAETVNLSVE